MGWHSLRIRIIAIIAGATFVVATAIGGFFAYRLYESGVQAQEEIRSQMERDIEMELKNETQVAVSLIEQSYARQKAGILTEEQAKKEAADAVRALRYDDGKGYFWIDTYDGVNVVLLGRPTEGKSRIDLVDPQGRHFIREMLEAGKKEGGGFTDLMFPKPNETEPLPKRNYTVAFAPYQWVLGTGVWIDSIDAKMAAQEAEAREKLIWSIAVSCVAGALVEVLLLLFAVWVGNRIAAPVILVTERLRKMAEGDFKKQEDAHFAANAHRRDELGTMTNAVLRMEESLGALISRIRKTAERVTDASHRLAESAEQSAQASSSVAESVGNVATSCAEQTASGEEAKKTSDALLASMMNFTNTIDASVKRIEETSARADGGGRLVENAVQQMQAIRETVDSAAKAVESLGEESKHIGSIVDTISQIAGQTNLLALNAAIEAARAGENGRGFTVVAEEVGKLAEESQNSASEIAALIESVQKKSADAVASMQAGIGTVTDGAKAVDEAGTAFHDIAGMVDGVAKDSRSMQAIVEELRTAVANITSSVNAIGEKSKQVESETENVSAATEEGSAAMEEIAASSQSLATEAEKLNGAVAKFSI